MGIESEMALMSCPEIIDASRDMSGCWRLSFGLPSLGLEGTCLHLASANAYTSREHVMLTETCKRCMLRQDAFRLC